MSPSGIQLNKTSVVVILVLCGGLALLYRFYWHTPSVEKKMAANTQPGNTQPGNTQPGTWFTQMMPVPEKIKEAAKKITVEKKVVDLTFEGQEMKIRTREPVLQVESRGDVLLLHGQKFTSETWVTKCPTLPFLGAAGYRAVAVDLPGYGESTKGEVGAEKRGSFIAALVKALKLTTPVIVSPSMSGSFSLPFLFDKPDTVLTRARGYVPVAPVETEKYASKFSEAKIPTAIVTGGKDASIGPKARKNLAALTNAKDFLLKDASHPAYLDDPETWHAILFTFLKTVFK
ncbi:protein ABHD14B-like [Mizuhopecten yessoensis]|uniref:Alpha/beta hydrolase domain-containing protein 14B n=1 Tax=Mizuhopecten yessoensis TaxID=6573 RepID=A0A210R016_MIZYE|nr:protein ABHD14B-like [Mizuhopecten yessoensis]OWF54358.1 Alpha/beta hydrolase domain-containing protein 14B [Mizuhopecten yessoensis]